MAAHTLYEKTHPFLLAGPGGTLDLSNCRYEQVTDRRVRVSGSRFEPARHYTVKLEGAKTSGWRSIFIAGARDPIFIAQIDDILPKVIAGARAYFSEVPEESYRIIPHLYGKNGVMGELEPVRTPAHELCIIVEVAAATQSLATAICGKVRTSLMHTPYPGRIATAGNLASPFTPLEIPLGAGLRVQRLSPDEDRQPDRLVPHPLRGHLTVASAPTPLRDIAKVIRSKNAGPFEITLDIVFKTKEDFEAVKKSGVITRELVSQLYNVPTQNIITFGFFDLINAVKITLPRPRAQGGIGETDMHAAQQHVPLQEIRVPWPAP